MNTSSKIRNAFTTLRREGLMIEAQAPAMKHARMLFHTSSKFGFIRYSQVSYQNWRSLSRISQEPFVACEYITSDEIRNDLSLNDRRVVRYALQRKIRAAFIAQGLTVMFGDDPTKLQFKILAKYNNV
jgi:hypothetical protein